MGLQRPADRDDAADAAELADALSELPEARIVRTPGTPREVLDSDAAPPSRWPATRARSRAPAASPTRSGTTGWPPTAARGRSSGRPADRRRRPRGPSAS